MKEKMIRFMHGRYGVDDFNKFLALASMVLVLLGSFRVLSLLSLIGYAGLIYLYFRMLSRNTHKRYRENQKFLTYKRRVTGFFWRKKNRLQQSRTHRFYKCPECKQQVRVPKGRGKIKITCPHCKTQFIKKS